MNGYFVTGTGTGIGKTYITAGLVRALRLKGLDARALKPVISGFDPAQAAESDPGILLDAMGEPADAIDRISPWRFAAPLAPDMAAEREGRAVDYHALLTFCRAGAGAPLFIEGVGGVMVPLDNRRTVLDWMVGLGLPVILVAGTYLGTLSHTLTAAGALRHARLRIAAVVVNETPESTVALGDTIEVLGRFLAGIPVCQVRRGETRFAQLCSLLEKNRTRERRGTSAR